MRVWEHGRLFAGGGWAYSRFDDAHLGGFYGGIEGSVSRFAGRLCIGHHEPDIFDRIGSTSGAIVSFAFNAAF